MPRPTTLNDLGFRYAIGDVLQHKGIAHRQAEKPPTEKEDWDLRRLARDARPSHLCCTLVVLERIAQECPGGVQFKYHCAACEPTTGNIVKGLAEFLEEELIPFQPEAS